MAEEEAKTIEKDQDTQIPAGVKKDELIDEDFEKVAGGAGRNLITTDAGT